MEQDNLLRDQDLACGPAGQDHVVLDPKHPGINDGFYVRRREMIYRLSRDGRIAESEVPRIGYTENDDSVWRYVCRKLQEVHERNACDIFLEGKKALGFEEGAMPELRDLSEGTYARSGFRLIPAEGMLSSKDFFRYLSRNRMPCTQYLRHHSKPEYTPEPDAVHDVMGHVPLLVDRNYAEIVRMIGEAGSRAEGDNLIKLTRFYWFTIEFGLIRQAGALKVFGAGLLSSFGEMTYCYSDDVDRRPLDIDDVVETDYDPTIMQPTLFVIESMEQLREATAELARRYGS